MRKFFRLLAVVVIFAVLAGVQTASAQTPAVRGGLSAPSADAAAEQAVLDRLHAAQQRKDYPTVFQILKPFADQGSALAQYDVAVMYLNGQGAPKDEAAAIRYLKLSAAQGYPNAEYNLATAYEKGQGLARDHALALQWVGKAAQHGVAAAQLQIATAYLQGDGTPRDYVQALVWTLQAADQGMIDAQFNAALIYEEGPSGVPRDLVQAYAWADLAANRSPRQAQAHNDAMIKERDKIAAGLTPPQKLAAEKIETQWLGRHAGEAGPLAPR